MTILSSQSVQDVFQSFDQGSEILQSALRSSYLDAVIENADNLLNHGEVHVEDGVPDAATVDKLKAVYQKIDLSGLSAETARQIMQLSFIKVMRLDHIQAIHQMTPDTMGMLAAFLIERLTKPQSNLVMLDPAVGTANLLTTVMNHLSADQQVTVHGYGVDNDDDLLAFASASAELQKLPVDLYHQDAVQGMAVPEADIVVSDLPVGYYPLDDKTQNYKTRAKHGHSYAHHLLIEQSVNYLRPGGFGVFLVPSSMFNTKETPAFVKWLQSVAHMQGLIGLPKEMFADARSQKSLLLLQRQGGGSKQAGQVLLGTFPSIKKRQEFAAFLRSVDKWAADNLVN